MPSSNYVGARSIEELAAALEKFNYTPRTEAERRAQSENLYRTQLEQALRNAQQTYEESDLALANQLIGLDTGYDRQRQSQEEATRSAISQADRHALSRGMQRSTYNNATLANLQNKGNEALARIEENRANERAGVEAQRAQLSRNLARAREGANADFESQVIAAMQRMADEDYQRKLAADQNNNSIQMQLYATQQAQQQFEDQMWFNRQKEGLGWSTAADAKGAGTNTGTAGMSVGEQNKAAILGALNGTAGYSGAAGANGSTAGRGEGYTGVRPTIQPVDGGTPGYESAGPAAGAGTGAITGNTNSGSSRKAATPPTSKTMRDFSATWGNVSGSAASHAGKAAGFANSVTPGNITSTGTLASIRDRLKGKK